MQSTDQIIQFAFVKKYILRVYQFNMAQLSLFKTEKTITNSSVLRMRYY
jgi:hypothetical protein